MRHSRPIALRVLEATPDWVFVLVPIVAKNIVAALPGLLLIVALGWVMFGSVNPISNLALALQQVPHP